MPKFTEGEWHICDGGIFTDANLEEDEVCVAQVMGCGINGKTYCGKDNAKLIAQAKNMYEVIKEALYDYETSGHPDCMDFCWPDKMRAIIAEIDKE